MSLVSGNHELATFVERHRDDPSSCLTGWVSPGRRYFYMGLGKTASTRIKLALHLLEGHSILQRPFPWLHARSSSDVSFVPNLTDFDLQQSLEILTSPEWFRFCFVRNPYHRLFSAYKSNIMQEMTPPSPIYNDIQDRIRETQNYARRAGRPGGTVTFRDFVGYVEQTIVEEPDYHWCTATWALRPDLIDYDFVGRVENFEVDFRQVLGRICEDSDSVESLIEPVNRSNVRGIPLAAVYDWELADRVYDIYEADFEMYEYEKSSWLYENG